MGYLHRPQYEKKIACGAQPKVAFLWGAALRGQNRLPPLPLAPPSPLGGVSPSRVDDSLTAVVVGRAVSKTPAEKDLGRVADELARLALKPGRPPRNEYAEVFGAASLDKEPALPRNELSRGRASKGAPRDHGRELLGEPARAQHAPHRPRPHHGHVSRCPGVQAVDVSRRG